MNSTNNLETSELEIADLGGAEQEIDTLKGVNISRLYTRYKSSRKGTKIVVLVLLLAILLAIAGGIRYALLEDRINTLEDLYTLYPNGSDEVFEVEGVSYGWDTVENIWIPQASGGHTSGEIEELENGEAPTPSETELLKLEILTLKSELVAIKEKVKTSLDVSELETFETRIQEILALLETLEPRDGVDGRDGVNGYSGSDGADGADGISGADGIDGADGEDGSDGSDGKTVEIRLADDGETLQWGYVGAKDSWEDIYNIASLEGEDGRPVEFNKSETHLQYRIAGDESWVDLVPLLEVTGPQGATGEKGDNVQLKVEDGKIQWKLASQDNTAWEVLTELTGEGGLIPHINPVTGTWFLNGEDTGWVAVPKPITINGASPDENGNIDVSFSGIISEGTYSFNTSNLQVPDTSGWNKTQDVTYYKYKVALPSNSSKMNLSVGIRWETDYGGGSGGSVSYAFSTSDFGSGVTSVLCDTARLKSNCGVAIVGNYLEITVPYFRSGYNLGDRGGYGDVRIAEGKPVYLSVSGYQTYMRLN